MKKFYFILPISIILTFSLISWEGYTHLKSGSGAKAGYTGSPSDGNTCVACHSGPDAVLKEGWITSNIPAGGYLPNTAYEITVHADGPGHNSFGFQASPQDGSGNLLGTISTSSAETILTGSDKYITHSSTGISGTDSKTWTFNWQSPGAGTGNVIFYASILVADGKGSAGDTTYISQLELVESSASGVQDNISNDQPIAYCDQSLGQLIIKTNDLDMVGKPFAVYNLNGKVVLNGTIDQLVNRVDVASLVHGIYLVRLNNGHSTTIKVRL